MKKLSPDNYLSPLSASEMYKNGAIIIDVREEFEFTDRGIAGDRIFNFPLKTLPEHCSQIPSKNDILLVCMVGFCSEKAAKILISHKFKNIFIIQGGLLAWSDEGLPMYSNPEKIPDELSGHTCNCSKKEKESL